MPLWQASDQWAINHAIYDANVRWHSPSSMKGIADFSTKFSRHAGSRRVCVPREIRAMITRRFTAGRGVLRGRRARRGG